MAEANAVKIALELLHVPSQIHHVRSAPLPDDVHILLKIVAADGEALRTATEITKRPGHVIEEAAAFFVEQVLLAPGSDSYRVLGASREATGADLKRNAGLLLRWLHPDMDPASERLLFVNRVTQAWNDIKTSERREAYDASNPPRLAGVTRPATRRRIPTQDDGELGTAHALHQRLQALDAQPKEWQNPFRRMLEDLLVRRKR